MSESLVSYSDAKPRLDALGWDMSVGHNHLRFTTKLSPFFVECYCIPGFGSNSKRVLEDMIFTEDSIAWLEREKEKASKGVPFVVSPTEQEKQDFLLVNPEIAALTK